MTTGAPSRTASFVLFVHVFYADIWGEIADLLAERVAVPFRVVVTTPLDPADLARPQTPFLLDQSVLPVENRGRDILPFLRALEAERTNFEIGLKLHTKRSPHRIDGESWRQAIVDSLMPAKDGVRRIMADINANPHVGLVAPEGLLLPLRDRVGANWPMMRRLAAGAGIACSRDDRRTGNFPAGSMFWFRQQALASLAASRLDEAFSLEAGQLDATAAHAVERLFALAAEQSGFVALPADLLRQATAIRTKKEARRRAAEQPIDSHAWQPSQRMLMVLRILPFVAWCWRRLPYAVRQAIKRVLRKQPGSPDR